jgi:hypothetical protein
LRWAEDTKDSAHAERLRERARQLFVLAEASDETDKHLTFALDEFNAQQLTRNTAARPVQQQQQQQQPQPKPND